jgi:glucose-6-phosphate isomerase
VVNPTENRAAEHSALRGVGKAASVEEAAALLERMKLLVEAIHEGVLGEVRHLIHIGIGGSALGPGAGGRRAGARPRAGRRPRGLEHRRARARGRLRRVRPGDDAGRGGEQDLHHDRDDDQCASALAWLADNGVVDPHGRVIALTAYP